MAQQKGFAHLFIIVGFIALIIGALSVVFWKNFIEADSAPAKTINEPRTENASAPQKPITLKHFTSSTGSGLSFSYPDTWLFDSSEEQKTLGNGTKVLLLMLTSEDPKLQRQKRTATCVFSLPKG